MFLSFRLSRACSVNIPTPRRARIYVTGILLSHLMAAVPLQAQAVPWSAPLRGSWVQAGRIEKGDVVLARDKDGSEIVVSTEENAAVHQSAEFLAGDIEKISGYRPPVVAEASGKQSAIRLVTLGQGPVPEGIGAKVMQGQWEAYRVLTDGKDVWLVGSNPRGTAFAAYTLSERLGIDPLYLWTGYVPAHHNPLVLKQVHFAQGPPTVKYRGFFHDDEDILPRPFDDQGRPMQTGDVPLEWYKKYFETALRLRMNMVAPYVRVHRRYEVQKLASDWGLYFTSHHYDILLSNPYGLERFHLAEARGVRPEWNWFTNKEGMLKYWRAGLEENKDLDVIWPVGMRGTADRPYTFPPETTDQQKAQVFHDAIRAQQFRNIVQSGATEFMLVNVSELREYVMGARMIADITWNAADIYAQPDPARRYVAWWSREYFGESAAPAVADIYSRYFTLLDRPERLWYAAKFIQDLLDRLYHKVAGESIAPLDADKLSLLQSRAPQLQDALAAEERAAAGLSLSQSRFLDEELALGLQVDLRQTEAALLLVRAVNEPDATHMRPLILQARARLEQLEVELMREEYPPFDRWYHETWIRSALSDNNPHRSYNDLRAFIACEGHGHLAREGPVGGGR
jgi:hypothetical protein